MTGKREGMDIKEEGFVVETAHSDVILIPYAILHPAMWL